MAGPQRPDPPWMGPGTSTAQLNTAASPVTVRSSNWCIRVALGSCTRFTVFPMTGEAMTAPNPMPGSPSVRTATFTARPLAAAAALNLARYSNSHLQRRSAEDRRAGLHAEDIQHRQEDHDQDGHQVLRIQSDIHIAQHHRADGNGRYGCRTEYAE